MSADWIVVGSGFRALVGAWLLARDGARVTLVDRATALGGILRGFSWDGHALDFGCHVFGHDDPELTAIMLDLLDGDVVPAPCRVASMLNGQHCPGVEIPDLRVFGETAMARMLAEVVQAAARPRPAGPSLRDLLEARYGPTAATLLDGCVRKQFAAPASMLAAEAWPATPMRRVRLADDDVSRLLKVAPALDDRIAVPPSPERLDEPRAPGFAHRAFYPAAGGMAAFSAGAQRRLEALGVTLALGAAPHRVALKDGGVAVHTADGTVHRAAQLLWTGDNAALLEALGAPPAVPPELAAHGVPMVLFYFQVPVDDVGAWSWAQSYDEAQLAFRASAPVRYGARPDAQGRTVVCVEVPTRIEDAVWRDAPAHAARAWDDARALGVVTGTAPLATLVKQVPVSYRLPRRGFARTEAALDARLAATDTIQRTDEWAFTKNAMLADLRRRLPVTA
ncbi:MAG: NAD(P)-binding protein [Gemmatimonadales bacterium]|nr:NAD(P)-binding protein [Gemmatimonadales bacterium]